MDDEIESEESADNSEADRMAAQLSELPHEDRGSLQQHRQANNVSGNKTVATLLEFSAMGNLFNKLHLSGLQLRGLPPEFTPSCISTLLLTVKSILNSEPSCLKISSPVVLFGDLHGEFHVLVKLTDILGKPPLRSYLFLGDYVDRGPHSVETLLYLLLLKSIHPQHVFVLRGNHEDRRVYRFFNFEDDLVRMFGLSQGQNLSSLFNTILCYMPVCAILNEEIFCCHGGLSPHFNHPRFASSQQDLVSRINQLPKPVLFRRSDFVADLLWSDPVDLQGSRLPNLQSVAYTIEEWLDKRLLTLVDQGSTSKSRKHGGRHNANQPKVTTANASRPHAQSQESAASAIDWVPNPRGCSYVFTKTAFNTFMQRYGLKWLIRGHMYVSKGYRECFDGRCITLFSAADYAQKYTNTGAVMAIEGRSNGRDLPGRTMRFSKQGLLHSGPLPLESAKWPHEILNRGAKL